MGKPDDGLERTATVVGLAADLKELIVTFINLIAAILGGLTSYTLAVQPNKTYLLNTGFELNGWVQFFLLLSATIAYTELLRHYWLSIRRKGQKAGRSLSSFLYACVFKGQHPIVVLPYIAALIIFGVILAGTTVGTVILIILLFISIVFGFLVVANAREADPSYTDLEASVSYSRFFWNLDDELIDEWFHRIQKLLHEQGAVTVRDLCHFINDRNAKEIAQAAWALEAYFRQYQAQYDLVRNWVMTNAKTIDQVDNDIDFPVKNTRIAYRS